MPTDRVPALNGFGLRTPSHLVLACIALCCVIAAAATADLLHTEAKLPEVSTIDCKPTDLDCFTAKTKSHIAHENAAEPLQDRFDSRAWFYAFGIVAAIGLATAYSLRTRPRRQWPRIFTNLGVIGVWLGIGSIALLLITDDASLKPPAGPLLLLPIALLVAAAAGALVGRSEGWEHVDDGPGVRDRVGQLGMLAMYIGTAGQAKRSRMEQLGRWASYATFGLAGVTVVLAAIFAIPQPACGGADAPPDWTDPIDSVAAVTMVAAIATAIGALLLRRWLPALISLVVCPIALLWILGSGCAFY